MNNDMLPVGTTFHINPEDVKWEVSGDLISRSALKKAYFNAINETSIGEVSIIDLINNAPTVTVDNYSMGYQDGVRKVLSERPQGEWLFKEITNDYKVYGQCSICKQRKRIDNYCSNCGAKMGKGGAE